MFLDKATIHARAGKGGDGCVSFRREKFVPRGGPDGGDGGRGGNIIIRAKQGIDTLLDIGRKREYIAKDGGRGQGKNKHGKNGLDIIVNVPPGAIIRDGETDLVLKDLREDGQSIIVARGGRGGKGNKRFASPTNRTPRMATPGEPGEERWIELELKLIADVGLVGLPNAGKSTLLSRISSAHPKIADYPFTTTEPQLGIVAADEFRRFVVADIPGLIEGAHDGVGLGDEFLRHVERTRIIAHIIDIAPPNEQSAAEAYLTIRNELKLYSPLLSEKREIIVANKMDLTDADKNLEKLKREIGREVHGISAVTGLGLSRLIQTISGELELLRSREE